MTKPPKNSGSSSDSSTTMDVGYGKPPLESRFKPGQSGNPKGRPKGAKNKVYSPGDTPIADMFLKEANRKITITESGKQKTISVLQATIRSISVSALKGNVRSQKIMLDVAQKLEAKKENELIAALDALYAYKRFWERILAERKRNNFYGADPIPHPDDIIIDPYTGIFRIEGPSDQLDKKVWDERIQTLVDLENSVEDLQIKLEGMKKGPQRDMIEQELISDIKLLEAVNKAIGNIEYVKRNKDNFSPLP